MCIQNLKTLALIEAKKFVTENLLGEKEKWTNKGNDKQQYADSLLHNTTSHTHFVPNFKISGTVVPEKSLIKEMPKILKMMKTSFWKSGAVIMHI